MAKSATLDVKILVDAAQAASGLNATANRFEEFAGKAAKMFAAAFIVDKAVEGIKKVVTVAADLEQAVGSVDAVFKSSAGQIHEWASDTSDSIRLPQREFERLAALIGSQLKNAGTSMEDLAPATRDLIQLGADLAAQFGGSTADAVSALSAALKGERDPIEAYGVSLTQAAIDAKALEIAQGDAAAAAERATQVQATLALIYDQTADAQGAASREAQTFTGQMDSLKEQLDNTAGVIGGPLLGAFGQLLDQTSTLLPTLEGIGVAAASVVSWIAGLPGPVLAAAAAFAVMSKLNVGAALIAAGAAMRTFVLDIRAAPSAMGAFSGALKGLGSALAGGAITAGLALVVGVVIANINRLEKASAGAKDLLKPVEDALTASGGNWTAATRQLQQAALMGTDAYTSLTRAGVSAQDALEILKGNADIWHEVQLNTPLSDLAAADVDTTAIDKIMEYSNALEGNAQARIANADAMGVQIDATGQVVAAQDTAAVSADDLATAYDNLIGQLQAIADNTAGAQVISAFENASKRAGLAADYLNASLDRLTGRQRGVESAQVGLIRGMQDVQAAFTGTDDKAGASVDAFNAWAQSADAASLAALQNGTANQDAYDSLTALTDGYTQVVSQAYAAGTAQGGLAVGIQQASDAADKSRADFVAMMAPILGSTEAAEALATRLGLLNGTEVNLSVLANTDEAQQKIAQLEAMNIDPKSIKLTADDQATPTVESAITYTDKVTGETRTIPLDADPASADAALATLIAAVTGSKPPPIPITANPAPATTTTGQFTSEKRETTPVSIIGNSAPARNAFEAFKNDYANMTITATLKANTGPAESAINAVANGSYTATIRAFADTSSFNATYNSLPTSRGVTAAPNVAPAPSLGIQAMSLAAPSLARTAGYGAPVATRTIGAAPATVIKINGALFPDDAARAVQRVLRARDRRTGSVVVGGTRGSLA